MSSLSSSTTWYRRMMVTPSCSVEELDDIITAPNNGHYSLPTDPYNEVFPNVFVGDGTTALCTSLLRRLGVTHVLNAACGKDRSLNLINTSVGFYRDSGIHFLGVEALDMSSFYLYPFFEEAAEFIHEGLVSGGRVYVHCRQGISRSATLVLAYLIMKRDFTVQEAVRQVRRQREIIPNQGFLKQLCQLNEEALKKRKSDAKEMAESLAEYSSHQISVA